MGSHDFIVFPPSLGYLSARSWLLMGEIQATAQHVRVSPILPAHAYELDMQYLAKGVHGTSAIDGNTFAEDEVEKIIRGELQNQGARLEELQQTQNMVEAYNKVARDEIFGETPPFSLELLHRYHGLVLKPSPESAAQEIPIGSLRTHPIITGRYHAPPPEDCERLMTQYCEWLNRDEEASDGFTGYDTAWSIVKALVAHIYFSWIQPYGDGNGRMARLIEHAILLRAGLPEICTHILSYFYNKTRRQYFVELQRSHGELHDGSYPETSDLRNFIEYALEGFMDELAEQMLIIRTMQVQAIWRDHIHACFPANLSTDQQRQKRLALDLTDRCLDQPAEFGDIRAVSTAIEFAYADQDDVVLASDLHALLKMDLLVHGADGYQPNPEIMMSLFGNSGISGDKKS